MRGDRGSERADLAGPRQRRGIGSRPAGPHGCAVEGEGMEPKREIFATFDLKDFEIRPREDLDGIRCKI